MAELHPIKDADFYKSLLDALPFTVAGIDKTGDILHTNWQWDQVGRENEIDPSYLGAGNNYFEICDDSEDEQAQEALEGLKAVVRGDREEFVHEYPCHSEDRKRWFIMRIQPFSVGDTTYYLVAHWDITERVQAEQRLRQAEKLASLGEMAAGVMHEINNPNAAIQLNVDYLKKASTSLKDALDESSLPGSEREFLDTLTESVQSIETNSERIEDIVEKISVFAGESEQSPAESFSPGKALNEVIEPFEERIPAQGALDADFGPATERILKLTTDRNELQQIAGNLIANAIDATPDDVIPEITVRTGVDGEEFLLMVEDNGTGIPDDTASKIFDPFYTTKGPGEGMGLGLSIVRGIIDRVDGDIDLQTEDGEGSTFTVKIPVLKSGNDC